MWSKLSNITTATSSRLAGMTDTIAQLTQDVLADDEDDEPQDDTGAAGDRQVDGDGDGDGEGADQDTSISFSSLGASFSNLIFEPVDDGQNSGAVAGVEDSGDGTNAGRGKLALVGGLILSQARRQGVQSIS